jgi:uncharacterized protein (TIGR04562 family)
MVIAVVNDFKKKNLEDWDFSWPVMNVLIGGRSSIDLPEINISGRAEASEFIKSYGYDSERANDARLMHATICEAWAFIERWLMPKEWKGGLQPPDEVLLCQDPCDLLMWACDRSPQASKKRMWSCAVLRVMHTIAHIEGAFRYSNLEVARDEIIGRIQTIVTHDELGNTWIKSGGYHVRLYKLDWKVQKSRESVLLKLLHKRANVAETIYDMLGLRIVTENQSDVMQIVKLLYRSHVISFPNAIPSRSRNSIADPDKFRAQLDQFRGAYQTDQLTDEQFLASVKNLAVPPKEDDNSNLHSGIDYQAIQLTCRQLIRTPRPLTVLRKNLQTKIAGMDAVNPDYKRLSELVSVLRNIARLSGDDEFSFFPFEIQVMDRKSWETNSTGKASHRKYKNSQLKTARMRVLHEVLG